MSSDAILGSFPVGWDCLPPVLTIHVAFERGLRGTCLDLGGSGTIPSEWPIIYAVELFSIAQVIYRKLQEAPAVHIHTANVTEDWPRMRRIIIDLYN